MHPTTRKRLETWSQALEQAGRIEAAAAALTAIATEYSTRGDLDGAAQHIYRASDLLLRHGRTGEARSVIRAFAALLNQRRAPATMIADSQIMLADVLAAEGRHAEADVAYRAELIAETRLDSEISATAQAIRSRMAANLDRWGRPADAQAMRRQAENLDDIFESQDANAITQDIALTVKADSEGSATPAEVLERLRRGLRRADLNRSRAIFAYTDQGLASSAIALALKDGADDLRRLHAAYNLALFTFLHLGVRDPSLAGSTDDEAFRAGQSLAQSPATIAVAQARARAAAGSDGRAELIRQHQDAQRVVVRLGERRRALARDDAAGEQAVKAELAQAGETLVGIEKRLRAEFPDYFAMVTPRTVGIAALQDVLREDEAVLLLVNVGGSSFQFGLSKNGFKWMRTSLSDLTPKIQRLGCQLDPVNCAEGTAGNESYDRAVAHELYQELIAPVEPAFGKAKRLYVQATGPVAAIPFSALLTAPPLAGDSDDPTVLNRESWLSERYAMTNIVSVDALVDRQPLRGESGISFRGFGAPTLQGTPDEKRGGAVRGIKRSADAGGSMIADPVSIRSLEPLPGTQVELEAMARALRAPPEAISLGDAATETALRSDQAIRDARVVAFATHGILPGELSVAEEPGLILTPPAVASEEDDGFLAASEVALLRFDADWLILSACNTATGENSSRSDGLSGLARSFLYAGAGALLASRWRIGDQVTATLTVETLRLREQGMRRADALQAAMRSVRTGMRADGSIVQGWLPDWAHPSAWAPFSVYVRFAE